MATKKHPAHDAITTVVARRNLSEVVNRVAYGKSRVVLTRRSRPIAAVVPIEDMVLLDAMEDREDLKSARKALRETADGSTISWRKLKKDLSLD